MGVGMRATSPANQGGVAEDVNLTHIAGNAVASGAGAATAGTLRVILATNDPAVTALATVNANLALAIADLGSILTGQTSKTQMVQITDGTREADVIATINSLKTDLSSVAGTVAEVNSGNLSAGVQRVCIATNDVNLGGILTAVQIIDNIVGVIGSAHGTGVAVVGFKAETTVPTAVADGQAVAAWADEYGRQVIAGYDAAQGAISVVDVAPAQMQIQGPLTLLSAVTGTGASAAVNVQDYENHTFVIIATNVTTGGTMLVQGSLDNTNWVTIATHNIVANGNYYTAVSGEQWHYVRANLSVRTDGTYTVQLESGN